MAWVGEVAGIVGGILGAAKKIYDFVKEVKGFKNESHKLRVRIENLMPAVNILASSLQNVPSEERTPEGLKAFSKPLDELLQLMNNIRDFTESLQEKKGLSKALHKDRIRTAFDEYTELLYCRSDEIHLSLTTEIREMLYQNKKGTEQILEEIKKLKISEDRGGAVEGLILIEIDFAKLSNQQVIAEGRFGTTYKAEYMHEVVALKSYALGSNEKAREVLLKEAQTLHRLNSGYIVSLRGVCIKNDPCLLVFEYMARGSLREVLDKVGPNLDELSWNSRIQMALDGAIGLCRMHNITPRPLMHQDLGSDIFLVGKNWKMKMSGVGFAQTQTSIKKMSKPARTGRSTMNYTCPERLKNVNHKSNASTDVYSYGIVMWEIATGSKPYKEYGSDGQIIQYVLNEKKKLPLPAECPEDFTNLIDQCRNFDPLTRPSSSDIVGKLQKIISSME